MPTPDGLEKAKSYEPIFSRASMMILKSKMDGLFVSLKEKGTWNEFELVELKAAMPQIRVLVQQAKEEAAPLVGELQQELDRRMSAYKKLYASVAEIIYNKDREGWDAIITTCGELKHLCPGQCQQSSMELPAMYKHAMAAVDPFTKALEPIGALEGVTVKVGPLKKLYRIIEKIMMSATPELGCATLLDVVRCLIIVESHTVHVGVLKSLAQSKGAFTIHKVKETYSDGLSGTWLDTKLIVSMPSDSAQHKCEIQIAHQKMILAREEMGGHESYASMRGLGETIELANGGFQHQADEKIVLLKQELERLRLRMRQLEDQLEASQKIDATIAGLRAQQNLHVLAKRFREAQAIQETLDRLKAGTDLDRAKLEDTVVGSTDVTDVSDPSARYTVFVQQGYLRFNDEKGNELPFQNGVDNKHLGYMSMEEMTQEAIKDPRVRYFDIARQREDGKWDTFLWFAPPRLPSGMLPHISRKYIELKDQQVWYCVTPGERRVEFYQYGYLRFEDEKGRELAKKDGVEAEHLGYMSMEEMKAIAIRDPRAAFFDIARQREDGKWDTFLWFEPPRLPSGRLPFVKDLTHITDQQVWACVESGNRFCEFVQEGYLRFVDESGREQPCENQHLGYISLREAKRQAIADPRVAYFDIARQRPDGRWDTFLWFAPKALPSGKMPEIKDLTHEKGQQVWRCRSWEPFPDELSA